LNSAADTVITLFHWNILTLPSGEEIFVGLRHRPETMPPFALPKNDDELMPFTLRNSSPIECFNQKQGVGYTRSGRRYVVIGKPSDPAGIIQMSINKALPAETINWKYAFGE